MRPGRSRRVDGHVAICYFGFAGGHTTGAEGDAGYAQDVACPPGPTFRETIVDLQLTRSSRTVCLIGSLVCGAVAAAPAHVQWLRYCTYREASRVVGDVSAATAQILTKAPEGLAIPEFKHPEPLFAKWSTPMAESGYVWLAFDRSRKRGQYDRLIADSNGNGSLADDEPTKAFSAHEYGAQFGPVRIVFQGKDGPVSYHLHADLYNQRNYRRLSVASACWYEGSVKLAGKTWRCQVVDYNSNGTFDDTSADFGKTDRIRLGQGDDFKTYFAGKYIHVDGKLYEASVAHDGAFVAFTPRTDVPVGTVRLTAQVTRFSAGGENGLFHIESSHGSGQLPAGTYRVYGWELERKDKSGALWKAEGKQLRDSFAVREDEETVLEVGEPLIASVKAGRRGGGYQFEQQLRGKLGESVSLTRNGSRPSAPKLRIRNATGDYEKTFTFEYG